MFSIVAVITIYHKYSTIKKNTDHYLSPVGQKFNLTGTHWAKNQCVGGISFIGGSRGATISLHFPASRGHLHTLAHGPSPTTSLHSRQQLVMSFASYIFLTFPLPPVSCLRILVIKLGLIQDNPPSLRSDDVKVQMISSFNSTGRLSYLLPYDLKFYKFQGIGYGYLLGGHYSACNNGILPLYE